MRRTLERAELQKIPGTFGDPIRVIQNFPGVARAPVHLRRSSSCAARRRTRRSPSSTAWRSRCSSTWAAGPRCINAEFIDKIDFYPGRLRRPLRPRGRRRGRRGHAQGREPTRCTARRRSTCWTPRSSRGAGHRRHLGRGRGAAQLRRRAAAAWCCPRTPRAARCCVLAALLGLPGAHRLRREARRGARASGASQRLPDGVRLGRPARGGGHPAAGATATSPGLQTVFHRVIGQLDVPAGNATSVFTPYSGYDLAGFGFGDRRGSTPHATSPVGASDLGLELTSWLTARVGAGRLRFEHPVARGEAARARRHPVPGFPGAEPKAEQQEIKRVINTFDGALYAEADVKLGTVTLTPGVRATYARHLRPDALRRRPAAVGALGSHGEDVPQGQRRPLHASRPQAFNMEHGAVGQPGPDPRARPFSRARRGAAASPTPSTWTSPATTTAATTWSSRPGDTRAERRRLDHRYAALRNMGLGRAYGMEVMLRHEVTKQLLRLARLHLQPLGGAARGRPRLPA